MREDEHTTVDYHSDYLDVYQHWCPNSERYCGGDGLVTAISLGWELAPVAYAETKWFSGNRRTTIYGCTLTRDGETMFVPVIENPYVSRLFHHLRIEVVADPAIPRPAKAFTARVKASAA